MALTTFEGAVAVITGGASGIGLAAARMLYQHGVHIVLADINDSGLARAADLIREQTQGMANRVIGVTTDVTDEEQVSALMQRARTEFGRIDLVMCSAGIGRGGPIDLFSGAEMQATLNINVMGIYHCVRAALPAMREQQAGHFVFMSSVAGKLGVPLLTAYCASKWAVRGFSMALRAELYGTGIGATTVYPAWVDTPMIHQEKDAMQLLNIEALLTPEQVANEILQAVKEGKTDLTLAPNHDIATLLQITHDAPDKAEQLSGAAFYERLRQLQ